MEKFILHFHYDRNLIHMNPYLEGTKTVLSFVPYQNNKLFMKFPFLLFSCFTKGEKKDKREGKNIRAGKSITKHHDE